MKKYFPWLLGGVAFWFLFLRKPAAANSPGQSSNPLAAALAAVQQALGNALGSIQGKTVVAGQPTNNPLVPGVTGSVIKPSGLNFGGAGGGLSLNFGNIGDAVKGVGKWFGGLFSGGSSNSSGTGANPGNGLAVPSQAGRVSSFDVQDFSNDFTPTDFGNDFFGNTPTPTNPPVAPGGGSEFGGEVVDGVFIPPTGDVVNGFTWNGSAWDAPSFDAGGDNGFSGGVETPPPMDNGGDTNFADENQPNNDFFFP